MFVAPGPRFGAEARACPGGCTGGLRRGLAEDTRGFTANAFEVYSEALEDTRSNTLALTDEAKKQVFGADIAMGEPTRFVDGEFDDFLGPWSQPNFAKDSAVAATDDELNGRANCVQFDAKIRENLRGNAIAFAHKS
jgi:hypothetical protein